VGGSFLTPRWGSINAPGGVGEEPAHEEVHDSSEEFVPAVLGGKGGKGGKSAILKKGVRELPQLILWKEGIFSPGEGPLKEILIEGHLSEEGGWLEGRILRTINEGLVWDLTILED